MLKKAFNASSHGDIGLAKLADEIAALNLPETSGENRALHLNRLASHVIDLAAKKKFFEFNLFHNTIVVKKSVFAREMILLKKLQDSFNPSSTLRLWINDRRKNYVDALEKQMPYKQLKKEWRDASRDGRLDIIRDLLKLQRRIYSGGATAFADVTVDWNSSLPRRTLGQNEIVVIFTKPDNRPRSIEVLGISLNPAIFAKNSSPYGVLSTAHHEQTHAFTAQLADAALNGAIGPDHPLHRDAMNTAHYRLANDNSWARLPDLYLNDPEEKLAREQQNAFIKEYARSPLDNLISYISQHFTPG